MEKVFLTIQISDELAGLRLDQALGIAFPEHSRSRLKGWILIGQIIVNGQLKRPRDQVEAGDQIEIQAEIESNTTWGSSDLPIEPVYEDDDLLVINKPANCVVHPAVGNRTGTLANALLHYCPALNHIPRAGIVHRLDKDTTGLMIVAKTLSAHTGLVALLQARQVKRLYEAVVQGRMVSGGTVDNPIGRHPKDRKRMAVVDSGKPAITHYRVMTRFAAHTHLSVQLETGRTHQIRVHMAHIRHPVVGDKTYGNRNLPANISELLRACLIAFPRQALHARSLALIHPITKKPMQWTISNPADFQTLVNTLRSESGAID